jgi:hypothetical protein
MDVFNLPDRYWHCFVKLTDDEEPAVVNDLTYADVERMIVRPWLSGQPFTVAGSIVRSTSDVAQIKIVHTDQARQAFSDRHYTSLKGTGIVDFAMDTRFLPFGSGQDMTFDLLFSGSTTEKVEPEAVTIETVCQRLPQVARILANRPRKGKTPFEITDEYDVQDLLHATIRAYLKYSVQEDPLPRVAAAKSARADISIEELGILIEVKFVRGPEDQRRIFEEFAQDLVLYAKWPHLKTLIYLIYNSADLRDPDAFLKLSAQHEIGGTRFCVKIILA